MKKQTRLLIIGSGPAGHSAAIYAARAGHNPIMICGKQKGGQITITQDIDNYPGFSNGINGQELMNNMFLQSQNLGVEIIEDIVTKVIFDKPPFTCQTENNLTIKADSIIIATGAEAKFLGIPSEKQFIGFGISTCATCDGFFYRNKDIAVIGGGNKAAKEALHLAQIARSVTIIHRRDTLRADKILQKKLFNEPAIKFQWNCIVEEFIGQSNPPSLTGIKIRNLKTDEVKKLKFDGIFLSIGITPKTDIFKGQINLTEEEYIKTAPNSTKTNVKGIFAAGDVQDPKYQQAIIAAASGAKAAMEANEFLENI